MDTNVDYLITRRLDDSFMVRIRWCGVSEFKKCDSLTDATIWMIAAAKLRNQTDITPAQITFCTERLDHEEWFPFGKAKS